RNTLHLTLSTFVSLNTYHLLFTSISYLLFLPLIVLAYYLCPARFRWVWLVLASVAYYLSFIPIFFALIGVPVIGNYFGGRWLLEANERGVDKLIYANFTFILYP
ncbi:MAG: hypothetical protein WCP32_19735, partial [Bacteroidota bacterium]